MADFDDPPAANLDANDIEKLQGLDSVRQAFEVRKMPFGDDAPPGEPWPGYFSGDPEPKAAKKDLQPLPLEWCEEIEPQLTGMWLVKRLIPKVGLALIYGHPACGKSFLALDIGMHVAAGWDWGGRKVKPGLVVYVAAEGQAGLRNRIVAFRKHHGLTGPTPLALVPCPIDLQNPEADRDRLEAAIISATDHYRERPALIVVDTISKTFGAGKENTDDMATYVANCQWLASAFECCVMPVHHRPKDADSTEPRGHSSLKGGLDTVILVEAGVTKRADVTKQKDGEIGERILFNLKVVELGHDEDGEPVTTCVVEMADVDMSPRADPFAQAVRKLSDGNRLVYDALGGEIEEAGFAPPAYIPAAELNPLKVGKVASLASWRDRYLSSAGTSPGQRGDSEYERARKAFERGLKAMQSKGIVKIWQDCAWITYEVGT